MYCVTIALTVRKAMLNPDFCLLCITNNVNQTLNRFSSRLFDHEELLVRVFLLHSHLKKFFFPDYLGVQVSANSFASLPSPTPTCLTTFLSSTGYDCFDPLYTVHLHLCTRLTLDAMYSTKS